MNGNTRSCALAAGDYLVLVDVLGEIALAAQLPVYLEDDHHFVRNQQVLSILGPWMVRHRGRSPEPFPELFRQVRGKGSQESEEGLGGFGGIGFRLLQMVDQDHHLRDRGVEAQTFDVLRYLLDRFMKEFEGVGVGFLDLGSLGIV